MVSIIVPTYRRDDLLCQTLTCLLQQDYPEYEIIVVDQTSEHDEATTKFLDQIKDRIRYFLLPKPNVSAARNFGAVQAHGDLYIFFDDDLMILPDTVRKVVATFADPSIAGVTGQIIEDDVPLASVIKTEIVPTRLLGGAFMAFRSRVFSKVGGFDDWFGSQAIPAGEDADFAYRATEMGFKLVVNKQIVLFHCGKIAAGGCGRHVLKTKGYTSDTDVFASLVVFWKNRKPGLRNSALAFWRGYHAYVLNLDLLRHGFKGTISKHARFFRLFRQVLRKPWLIDAE